MSKLTIKTATEADFFRRGRELAQQADRAEPLRRDRTISFEDPSEIMKLITETRVALFRAVSKEPGSITQISQRLGRDRSAVKRDLDELARAGLVTVTDTVLPGHGRMKEVRATAKRVTLQAEVA